MHTSRMLVLVAIGSGFLGFGAGCPPVENKVPQRPNTDGAVDTDVDTDEPVDDTDVPPDDTDDTDDTIDDGPFGFVGSPCESNGDCNFTDGFCYFPNEGFPRGTCSAGCDRLCPDAAGHPTTFCVVDSELPANAPSVDDGACLSRCDFSYFPNTGCRPDYGCVVVSRANEPSTETHSCLPNRVSDLSDCQLDLAARGVGFSPTIRADQSPASYPNLTCHVQDPVYVHPPLFGVDLVYYDGAATPDMLMSCEGAQALADTVENVKPDGVTTIRHIGTTVCRVISGTSTLSQHSHGAAIDIYSFEFSNGDYWSLYDEWEHETTSFSTDAAEWLYETAYDWHDQQIWNTILTPNFNDAHDNHFHVDLDPTHNTIGFTGQSPDPFYIGPAWYND